MSHKTVGLSRAVWLSAAIAAAIVGCGPKAPVATSATTPPGSLSPATAPSQQSAADDPIIATAGNVAITRSALYQPLLDAYGFDLLMLVVQRDLSAAQCREMGIVLGAEDFAKEREWTLKQMFEKAPESENREKLLDQFLAQPKPREQMRTRTEFDLLIETNAYQRKIAEKNLKNTISDDDLRMEFDRQYASQVQVRHIQVANTQEALAVRQRLDAGEDFAAVARKFSRNAQTARLGGELPPFTINDKRDLPDNFREVAFALKEGEVSDPVVVSGSYHIIKLEKRIPQKAVKFEDVKDSLRESIELQIVIEGVKQVRALLAQQALATLKISDPILKAEFDERLAARNQLIRDREKISEEMEKQRSAPPPPAPTTESAPATAPATKPSADSAPDARPKPPAPPPVAPPPPATRPAAPPPPPAPKLPATAPAASPPPATKPAGPRPAVPPVSSAPVTAPAAAAAPPTTQP
ncbi:MAG TPA: peptidylprolyl isomerase [Tepidisphaeraceae bacterium]